jgi:hypothetical protein
VSAPLTVPEPVPEGERAAKAPRIIMPLLASLMISLSLERLEVLHWIPATALFLLLALFVLGVAASQRRALRERS